MCLNTFIHHPLDIWQYIYVLFSLPSGWNWCPALWVDQLPTCSINKCPVTSPDYWAQGPRSESSVKANKGISFLYFGCFHCFFLCIHYTIGNIKCHKYYLGNIIMASMLYIVKRINNIIVASMLYIVKESHDIRWLASSELWRELWYLSSG